MDERSNHMSEESHMMPPVPCPAEHGGFCPIDPGSVERLHEKVDHVSRKLDAIEGALKSDDPDKPGLIADVGILKEWRREQNRVRDRQWGLILVLMGAVIMGTLGMGWKIVVEHVKGTNHVTQNQTKPNP